MPNATPPFTRLTGEQFRRLNLASALVLWLQARTDRILEIISATVR